MNPPFRISNNFNDMDLKLIHEYLVQAYWCKGIPFETLKQGLKHSLCFGVFNTDNEQIAFARTVTDYATYAYLADVFVVDAYRGQGVGKYLLQAIQDHPQLQGLRRITLATKDAHGLYAQFGFTPLANPAIFMERWNPNVYD